MALVQKIPSFIPNHCFLINQRHHISSITCTTSCNRTLFDDSTSSIREDGDIALQLPELRKLVKVLKESVVKGSADLLLYDRLVGNDVLDIIVELSYGKLLSFVKWGYFSFCVGFLFIILSIIFL